MTSGSDDGPESGGPNFADVMNAFSFDSARSSKRRKRGRRRAADAAAGAEADQQAVAPAAGAAPDAGAGHPATPPPVAAGLAWVTPTPGVDAASGPVDLSAVTEPEDQASESAAAVRPYAWTRGRTKSGFDLAIETLLSTSRRGHEQLATLPVEHRVVAQLCEQTRSVAEVAALLAVPLGVARVLLGDMAGLGLVMVHETVSSVGNVPDLALMERVLIGLRRL